MGPRSCSLIDAAMNSQTGIVTRAIIVEQKRSMARLATASKPPIVGPSTCSRDMPAAGRSVGRGEATSLMPGWTKRSTPISESAQPRRRSALPEKEASEATTTASAPGVTHRERGCLGSAIDRDSGDPVRVGQVRGARTDDLHPRRHRVVLNRGDHVVHGQAAPDDDRGLQGVAVVPGPGQTTTKDPPSDDREQEDQDGDEERCDIRHPRATRVTESNASRITRARTMLRYSSSPMPRELTR